MAADNSVFELRALLDEAEQAHTLAEKRLPPHDWQLWYAAFITGAVQGVPNPVFHADDVVQNTPKVLGGTYEQPIDIPRPRATAS